MIRREYQSLLYLYYREWGGKRKWVGYAILLFIMFIVAHGTSISMRTKYSTPQLPVCSASEETMARIFGCTSGLPHEIRSEPGVSCDTLLTDLEPGNPGSDIEGLIIADICSRTCGRCV